MNTATIIYDNTGRVWHITYGDASLPASVSAAQVSVPDNQQLSGIEIAEDGTITPKYETMPLSSWQQIQEAIQTAKEEAIATVNPTINVETCTLQDLQEWRIKESKTALAIYLEENPLISSCHGGVEGTYSITEEKRNMFTSKFTAHLALEQAGIADTMTWNETGKECEEWTDAECLAFISEWNTISTALVKYQQELEIAIKACEDKDSVQTISIDYQGADPRNKVTDNENITE